MRRIEKSTATVSAESVQTLSPEESRGGRMRLPAGCDAVRSVAPVLMERARGMIAICVRRCARLKNRVLVLPGKIMCWKKTQRVSA